MSRGRTWAFALVAGAVWLHCAPSCAHQQEEEPPLYEDLLFAQIDKDRPAPETDDRFGILDELIDDELPAGGHKDAARIRRPESLQWEEYADETRSESVGKPNKGYLRHGRSLPRKGHGFLRKNDKAPYGTDETVAIITWACLRMERMYPGTVPVVIGNLSRDGGGRLKPHASHQSGRDVDIGYYFLDNDYIKRFKDATPDNLDVEKSWTLIELLLSTHRVQYLFIDKSLQPLLYEEAAARGWTEEELQELFEAPLGAGKRRGLIRHSRGHKHHLHVRFKCDKSDSRCK